MGQQLNQRATGKLAVMQRRQTWKSKGFSGLRLRAALLSTPFSLSMGLYSTFTAPEVLSPAPANCINQD